MSYKLSNIQIIVAAAILFNILLFTTHYYGYDNLTGIMGWLFYLLAVPSLPLVLD